MSSIRYYSNSNRFLMFSEIRKLSNKRSVPVSLTSDHSGDVAGDGALQIHDHEQYWKYFYCTD